jgi:hypothetical protein
MKIKNLVTAIIATFLITSCAHSYKGNASLNYHSTEAHVELSKKNFKVVDYVTGEATTTYILRIGGFSKRSLIEKARSEMYKNANLVGTSRVILNENVDYYTETYPFVSKVKVTVSGYVYEFTE